MEHKQEFGRKETRQIDVDIVEEEDVSFFHDFVAGGIAGSASVVVGHPFDTIKVRMQTSSGSSGGLLSLATSYGGVSSLFRGMAAPLSTACVVNAIIFSSYGWSSRMFDQYVEPPTMNAVHDSTIKAFTCGSFAGLVQGLVICPMEHLKCRLQVQHGKGAADNLYKGPVQAARSIVSGYGFRGLYRGWCVTAWREVPAFGGYFALYDFFKDNLTSFFAQQSGMTEKEMASQNHSYLWASSALAGGTTGALTWAVIYPFDIIKTRIQTAPMETPIEKRRIVTIARNIIQNEGVGALFRGLNVTVIRAFPVNGIIFPVYEYVLMKMAELEY
mmetsp:Transcript_52577/g.151589  ORF Transcript_52577/g.151589 Transcript_52577/m.151589 type:complete len:329 (+) Transcript_52577:114-1100(+)|eukprot:CAMPEP_0176008744 /NCGR_PEP_ID=MMETSP0120_2-20121206/3898_1 /TAXON_ID=160619 /ORGANISM="Kryptoperidinium foliaceum, Strain CCMP 1326" /LENGTH=328 /DNA_ID=CAMNT_0017341529 /DNA_START=28 /DNA_END=1014 /DNA_ORIENTATION=-